MVTNRCLLFLLIDPHVCGAKGGMGGGQEEAPHQSPSWPQAPLQNPAIMRGVTAPSPAATVAPLFFYFWSLSRGRGVTLDN